jgi:hypothetical protein
MADADAMKLVDQLACYQSCGLKIKEDLLDGDAVVLFAYGLSGSGKTFTVFGPDAADAPVGYYCLFPIMLHTSYSCYRKLGSSGPSHTTCG